MIESYAVADLSCDRRGCTTDPVYGLSHNGDDWELPKGWLRLEGKAAKIEWDRAKERFEYAAPPEHLCPTCSKDHTPEYVQWKPAFRGTGEVMEYCDYCGDDRPCRADKEGEQV